MNLNYGLNKSKKLLVIQNIKMVYFIWHIMIFRLFLVMSIYVITITFINIRHVVLSRYRNMHAILRSKCKSMEYII